MNTIDTYVACAMTAMPEEEYEDFRHTVLLACDALRERGFVPYSEPYEDGLENIDAPEDALAMNRRVLDGVKQFVLIYTHKESSSALIELGYAWAREVPILAFVKNGVKTPYYLRDEKAAEKHGINIVEFKDIHEVPDLIQQVEFKA